MPAFIAEIELPDGSNDRRLFHVDADRVTDGVRTAAAFVAAGAAPGARLLAVKVNDGLPIGPGTVGRRGYAEGA